MHAWKKTQREINTLSPGEVLELSRFMPLFSGQAVMLAKAFNLDIWEVLRLKGRDVSPQGVKTKKGWRPWPLELPGITDLKDNLSAWARLGPQEERLFWARFTVLAAAPMLGLHWQNAKERRQLSESLARGPEKGRLPDFLVLGAPRSATTWLHSCLDQHPGVFVTRQKEPEFWNDRAGRHAMGLAWYKSLFAEAAPGQLAGEVSVWNLQSPEAALRIHEHLGSLAPKLIVNLRDPAERAHSIHKYRLSRGELPGGFGQAVRSRAWSQDIIESGHYYRYLRKYFDLFPRENIHVIIFDDVQRDPMGVLGGVSDFLGIDAGLFDERTCTPKVIPSYTTRLRPLHYQICNLSQITQAFLPRKDLARRIGRRLDRLDKKLTQRASAGRDEAELRTLRALKEEFRPSNRKLAEMIGRDLSCWD